MSRTEPVSISAVDVARVDDRPLWVEISGNEVWWDEPRPHEGGRRCVVRRRADGVVEDVLPQGWNARNRVIEYGGRSWRSHRGSLVFTNWADQRLYVCPPGGEPVALTPEGPARYGDLVIHDDEVWCVREIGRERTIVAVPLDGGPLRVIVKAHHFLMHPRISPDGRHIAWIGWNHPDMPWDATELCVAPIESAPIETAPIETAPIETAPGGTAPDRTAPEDASAAGRPYTVVAGGAVAQAEWRDARSLYAVTDPTGWWNIHIVPLDLPAEETDDASAPVAARNLTPLPMEFGDAVWKLGQTFFAVSGGTIVTMYGTADRRRLGVLDESGAPPREIGGDATYWSPTLATDGTHVVGVAASHYRPYEVVRIELATGERETLSPAKALPPAELLPTPESVTIDGVHAHLYPPLRSALAEGPPPYVVFVHGGPTSAAAPILDLEVAYFTSRGIGVAEVNYGGSTGYGRAYRERLRHNWGVVDVQDCETVARHLLADGRAAKVAIRGGSAGGWTSLAALVHSDVFCGAVSHYGIGDPESWAAETHDFESRYLDGLIGPLPETRQRYIDRSPALHAARASGPALLMHGLEDAIVDPAQAERFAAELDRHGGRWAYLAFPGEQHGWRREETIVAVLEAELAFYGLIFDFPTPEVPPLALRGPSVTFTPGETA
ncbi:prolyl oligopeptidase family serine peptidase [Microtetraspora sp. NBRC 16547]|uniref:dipeptidyl-peptidase 5 n=1 Tax=Microtetraspora sp. NBRC 16547 TaxID=3030993 RepID=UPI0024A35662|nr:prolyl oligopeptidase family serine peptidase [Microtetraspora sp. NBRC 16547]GLX01218.1 acyl-peptide hydrolase [Microtetraspora sp. NBRC 16547]